MPTRKDVRHHMRLCPGKENGVSGWRLYWRVPDLTVNYPVGLVRLHHWFEDVDEATAVKQAMQEGRTFEAAHAALVAGELDMAEAVAASNRFLWRARMLTLAAAKRRKHYLAQKDKWGAL